MVLRISLLILIVVFVACKDNEINTVNTVDEKTKNAKTNYLIEANELLKIINEPNIKVLDFRKAKFYAEEHIDGALNIWRTDIEDTSYPYTGMMAGIAQIETLFSGLGINTSDTIIIYDDNGLCDSSRLWWILQNYDFTNVKLFHGGIAAWKTINGSMSSETATVKKGLFKLSKTPSMKYHISKEDMLQAVIKKALIVDTRTHNEFTGKLQKKGAAKGGRIPNSKWINWSTALDYNGGKKIKSIEKLKNIYHELGASKNDSIIVYCHSGVRSAHTTFILSQVLNYKNVKNYDGSWTEWSQFNDLPIKQDSLTILK